MTTRWIAICTVAAALAACKSQKECPEVTPSPGSAGSAALAAKPEPKEAKEPPRPDAKDIPANIDRIANKVLADLGVPSAVVAAVADGKIVYAHAYGNGRIEPKTPATLAMRYSIGSISKQLTATAILLLVEDKKLALDDKVEKYVPGLTRGNEVTIRQLLSHTAGYPDYAPQDYIVPEWQKPIDAQQILARWAKVPLEFDPGTRWQYSNTNFVIAGLIVEKAAGKPLFDFLSERVFRPLGMTSVTNSDLAALSDKDAQGTFRRALGPNHPAPHEGPGWMYAAGELAMTVEDLAKWDLAVIEQKILSPASYKALATEVLLANGAGTRYGLGIGVTLAGGKRVLSHSGEVSGFVAANQVMPDDKIAVAVLTNQDASAAADKIASQTRDALLRAASAPSQDSLARVRAILDGLAAKQLDRSKLTDNANAYFSDEAIAEFAASLQPLGAPVAVEQTSSNLRGGMTQRRFQARYDKKALTINVYETRDGKIEQFLIDEDR